MMQFTVLSPLAGSPDAHSNETRTPIKHVIVITGENRTFDHILLNASNASQLATHSIQYETGFTLLPGKYVIKYLACDADEINQRLAGPPAPSQSQFASGNLGGYRDEAILRC
jgi:phospholipase C